MNTYYEAIPAIDRDALARQAFETAFSLMAKGIKCKLQRTVKGFWIVVVEGSK